MSDALTLVMDTSHSPLLLAVEKKGRIFQVRRKGIKQEQLLFPALHKLLAQADSSLPDVKRVFVVRGPGRFTGIRISLTAASMLRMLTGAQVGGATLFEVLARQVQASTSFKRWQKQHADGVLAVVLHAFREEYFLQVFEENSQGPQWLSRSEVEARLSAYKQPVFVAGTDREMTPLAAWLGKMYPLAAWKDCIVCPKTLVQMACAEPLTAQTIEPLYLKPARFELITPS